MTSTPLAFDIPADAAVVTTSHVTQGHLPVLCVFHEMGEGDEILWQFHCGNGDYSPAVLQLVRLDEILGLDASLAELANLPVGWRATRASAADPWIIEREGIS